MCEDGNLNWRVYANFFWSAPKIKITALGKESRREVGGDCTIYLTTDKEFVSQALQTGGCHRINELEGAVVRHPDDAARQDTRQRLQPGQTWQPSGKFFSLKKLKGKFYVIYTVHILIINT